MPDDTQLDRIETMLTAMNSHTREHGELLAAHDQWMASHEGTHKAQDKQIDRLSTKQNIVAGGNALLALVAGALGIMQE